MELFTKFPKLEVHAEEWLAFEMIFRWLRAGEQVRVALLLIDADLAYVESDGRWRRSRHQPGRRAYRP